MTMPDVGRAVSSVSSFTGQQPGQSLAGQGVLPMQPALVRMPDSIWTRAERLRDEYAATIERACAAENVDALVIKSAPSIFPPQVRFACWVPREDPLVTERGEFTLTIMPREFFEYEFEYKVELVDRIKKTVHPALFQFTHDDATKLVRYLLRRGPEPKLDPFLLRRTPIEFWRPRNRVRTLDPDWAAFSVLGAFMLGVFTLSVIPMLSLLLWVGALVGFIVLSRRDVVVRSPGKPHVEPRTLLRVDSWQTVISGLGDDAELVLLRFHDALKHPPTREFTSRIERIWYWGLDGKVEREQIVLTLGRGILFLQIHPYEKELYVGWDAHLNAGQWVEKTLQRGIDRQTRRLTVVNTVVPGVQKLSEYDVTDVSCLIEWTHAKLTQIIKRLMEERKIDQEVDFQILRGARQGLTERKPDEEQEEHAGVASRLKKLVRTG